MSPELNQPQLKEFICCPPTQPLDESDSPPFSPPFSPTHSLPPTPLPSTPPPSPASSIDASTTCHHRETLGAPMDLSISTLSANASPAPAQPPAVHSSHSPATPPTSPHQSITPLTTTTITTTTTTPTTPTPPDSYAWYQSQDVDLPPNSIQPIIHYKSMTNQEPFFNPASVYNQREFVMRTNVEYLLLVDPPLAADQNALLLQAGHLTNSPAGSIVVQENTEPQIICLKIKHTIPAMTMLVPVRTPLSFLLRATKLHINMYTIPLTEAQQCIKDMMANYLLVDLPPINAPHRLVMFDEHPAPLLRPNPYRVPYLRSAADIRPPNLLSRRTLNNPRFF